MSKLLESRWIFSFCAVMNPHLSNQYERYKSQYTFVNPFETDLTNYLKSIFIMILRPHGSSFEIFDPEIEAFALEKQCWDTAVL